MGRRTLTYCKQLRTGHRPRLPARRDAGGREAIPGDRHARTRRNGRRGAGGGSGYSIAKYLRDYGTASVMGTRFGAARGRVRDQIL